MDYGTVQSEVWGKHCLDVSWHQNLYHDHNLLILWHIRLAALILWLRVAKCRGSVPTVLSAISEELWLRAGSGRLDILATVTNNARAPWCPLLKCVLALLALFNWYICQQPCDLPRQVRRSVLVRSCHTHFEVRAVGSASKESNQGSPEDSKNWRCRHFSQCSWVLENGQLNAPSDAMAKWEGCVTSPLL